MTGAERKDRDGAGPHRVIPDRERNLETAIGRQVRVLRQNQRITVKQLSEQTGLSIGMLSKIENGVTSPSLTTLQSLARALNVPLTALFRQFEEGREAVHTKAGEGAKSCARARARAISTTFWAIWRWHGPWGVGGTLPDHADERVGCLSHVSA
jgi:transcriptional regulator with XRE-family HTH domain